MVVLRFTAAVKPVSALVSVLVSVLEPASLLPWWPIAVTRRHRYYPALVLLLALAAFFQIGNSTGIVDGLRFGTQRARTPMDFGFRMRAISGMTPEAAKVGIHWGDTLEEVNGRPFTGIQVLLDEVNRAHPGDLLEVKVRLQGGAVVSTSIQLAPRRAAPPRLADWLVAAGMEIALPVFCLCLGFWVAGVRPSDPLAWLLLGLMLSFSQMIGTFSWRWPLQPAALSWHLLLAQAWPIWMFLFGVRFPEPAGFDRRRPWLKWILLVPLTLLTLLFAAVQVGKLISFDAVAPLRALLFPLARIQMFLNMAAIGVFFACLGHKSGTATTRDGRRRLKILWIGASISLTPMFLEVLHALAKNRDPLSDLPEWAVLTILFALALFPLTMAYVVVVQRAMEVRMVLRQSARYALARGGLWVIRILIASFAATAVAQVVESPKPRNVDKVRAAGSVVAFVAVQRRLSRRVSLWLDRRFFREAYSAEQVLSELSEEARNFVEAGPLLDNVTRRISNTLHVPRIAVLLKVGDGYCVAHTTGHEARDCCLAAESRTLQYLRHASRPALVYFDDPDSWIYDASGDDPKRLRMLDAQLLLPIIRREELLGIMVLGPKLSEEPYSPTDIQLLQSVATQTGLAIENSRLVAEVAAEAAQRERLNREIEIAREVQERLFPQDYPPVPGINYCGKCRPASAVGGDYYDFLALPGGKLGIAIGDVSGKGISAALLMSGLRASLRGQTIAGVHDLAGLMRNVNLLVYEASAANRYATFFYGEYDPATRRLEYVNAGHNAPMILRGEEAIRLEAGGPVVGLLKPATYAHADCDLQPGDVFIGFTDGISEAMTGDDEEWGEDRLLETAQSCRDLPACEMIERIIQLADAFTAGARQHDDMTLLVVKVQAR